MRIPGLLRVTVTGAALLVVGGGTTLAANPSAVGGANPPQTLAGDGVVLSAVVTPGDTPASTGLVVLCHLSAIGGSAFQALFDNGINGDAVAGDNTFAFSTSVAVGTPAGTKLFPCQVSDAQGRSDDFDITLQVLENCGDGTVEVGEACDDGDNDAGDGCDMFCTVEPGWGCTGNPSICTPSTTSTSSTISASTTSTTAPPSAGLDHFTCYKASDTRNPPFVPQTGVVLTDQFGATTVDIKKPALLCAPADMDGSGINDSVTHVCCYKLKSPKLAAPIAAELADGFGSVQVRVKKSLLLCLPCTKTPLP